MNMPEPMVKATRYEVSCLPENNVNARHFTLRVEHRGDGRWCVTDGHNCLSADGTWGYEPMPSNRDGDWLNTHRFDLDTAIQHAKDFAPKLTINGMTAADVLAANDRPAET